MKSLISLTGLLFVVLALLSIKALAIEPVNEQQLMFYYEVPMGANSPKDTRHKFGLRVDQTAHTPGETVQLESLMKKQAVLDFRMGYNGKKKLNINGVDYLENYRLARAAAGEDSTTDNQQQSQANTETEDFFLPGFLVIMILTISIVGGVF